MAVKLSRRRITHYVADNLATGTDVHNTLMQLAGYLVDTRRTKELDVIVRDIEYALAERGLVSARVVTAFKLSYVTRQAIEDVINSRKKSHDIQLQHVVDPAVLGGLRLDIPGFRLDTTLAHTLSTLRTNYKK